MTSCELFGLCGGCRYRDLAYAEQLEQKKNEVKSLLAPVLGGEQAFDTLFEGIHGSPAEDGYRNKMEYSFGDAEKDGPLTLGLHRKGSRYDVLTVDCCRIVHDDFNRIVAETLRLCREAGLRYYHKRSHEGYLRHLLVRRATTGEILVDLVTSSQWAGGATTDAGAATGAGGAGGAEAESAGHGADEATWLAQLSTRLRELDLEGGIVGILHTVNDAKGDAIKNDSTDILFGRDYITEEILGLRFKITPFSFFQTNTKGAELLYSIGREYIGALDGATVFDLYSGTGTIAQVLAPVAKKVIGVEIVEEAVEAAKENAAANGLSNCDFLAGDVLKVIDGIEEKPDMIVLDPPREGINPKALPKIIAYGVERILYISCKPSSLARDLPSFLEAGYRAERLCCVDLFPAAAHIETVVFLRRL